MAKTELKTKKTEANVEDFLNEIADENVRADCKKIAVGTVVGSMTLSGFKDESGALCNASAPPLCECKGKITSVRLTYVGPSGVTVRAYKANNHTQLINV